MQMLLLCPVGTWLALAYAKDFQSISKLFMLMLTIVTVTIAFI